MSVKNRITRIPIDQKFLEDLLEEPSKTVENISREHSILTASVESSLNSVGVANGGVASPASITDDSTEASLQRAWQTLAIILSLSVMLAVFAIILIQVMRLLHERRPLPSLSSLEMQNEHDRIYRTRYTSTAVTNGRKPVQVILSSKNVDVNNRKRLDRSFTIA